jgi:hypothetical protein
MANKDAAFGFRPVRHLTGGEIKRSQYKIAANYNTAIYKGQAVKAVTAGGIEAAAAGNVVLGIFYGCFYTDPTTIQQAQMLLILKRMFMMILESYLKSNMMALELQH